jgi:hypothetical protein
MPEGDLDHDEAPVRHGALPSTLLAVGVAVGVAVAAIGIVFSIIAVPLYALAATDPASGLDRALVRRGLFGVALPVGVLVGIAVGVAVGIWYGRGGRLPQDRAPLHEQ